MDGKHLRGNGKGKSSQVKRVEVLALHLRTTLAQAQAEGREDRVLLEFLERLDAGGWRGWSWSASWLKKCWSGNLDIHTVTKYISKCQFFL